MVVFSNFTRDNRGLLNVLSFLLTRSGINLLNFQDTTAFNLLFVLQIKFLEPWSEIIKKEATRATFPNKIIPGNVLSFAATLAPLYHAPFSLFLTYKKPTYLVLFLRSFYKSLISPALIKISAISVRHLILIIIYLYLLASSRFNLLHIVLLFFGI